MPPTNFFGSLGNTNLFRRHGHISGLFLNFADDTNVPGGARLPEKSIQFEVVQFIER